jgi:DNA-binding response OmpR family regulator
MRQSLKPRVLLVDDDAEFAETFRESFDAFGYDVTVHPSLITVPLVMRAADPDVVLLDVDMPALSGTSFLMSGGRNVLRTEAPVVLFSGMARERLERLSESVGADGCISKDRAVDEILRELNAFAMNGSRAMRTA